MKVSKIQEVGLKMAELKRQYQAEQEIRNFLRALHTYPESFAHQPGLSFEEHLYAVTAQSQPTHLA
jgi:hypothetical protein